MSEAKLPTEEDIAKLPRWARVAFAARCARRALPLFVQHWPDAPSVHLKAIEKAISVAEDAAADAANAANAAGVPVVAIARDFQTVLDAATQGRWDDNTTVPPSVFGPLDEPEPTPLVVETLAEPPKKFKLVIEAYATEQTDPQETARRLVGLYEKLDEYCRLKYGRGLTLKEFEQHVRVGSGVPVGG
jgi:hypothetical protein